MLIHLKNGFTSCSVEGLDGTFGTIEDVIFDDEHWTVRYLTVKAGSIFNKERLFISPDSVEKVVWTENIVKVNITKDEAERAPSLEEQPITRKKEMEFNLYYRFTPYWTLGVPISGHPGPESKALQAKEIIDQQETYPEEEIDQEEHSFVHYGKRIIGYELSTADDSFGKIQDILMEEGTYKIRYFIADTKKILPGKTVLIPIDWIDEVDWLQGQIRLNVTKEQLKNAPNYEMNQSVGYEMETALYDLNKKD